MDMTKVIPLEYYLENIEPITWVNDLWTWDIPEWYALVRQWLPSNSIATEDLVVTGDLESMSCKFDISKVYGATTWWMINWFQEPVYDNCLTHFEIPEKIDGYPVFSINSNAFNYDYTNVRINSDVTIPNSVTIIWDSAFKWNRIKVLTLWTWLITIDNSAFELNNNMSWDLIIPNSVTKIGSSAFSQAYYNTWSIHHLVLWTWLQTVWQSAFRDNYFQWNLVIHNSITSIEAYSFMNSYKEWDNNTGSRWILWWRKLLLFQRRV